MLSLTSANAVELLTASGSQPTEKWAVRGKVVRAYDPVLRSYALTCDGGPTTRLALPKDERKSMSLPHRIIVLQLTLSRERPFSFELSMSDAGGARRRLAFSTSIREAVSTPLHTRLPLLDVPRGVWINLCIDLGELLEVFFAASFLRLDGLALGTRAALRCEPPHTSGSACKVRRIFALRSLRLPQTSSGAPLSSEAWGADSAYQLSGDSADSAMPRAWAFGPGAESITFALDARTLAATGSPVGSSGYQSAGVSPPGIGGPPPSASAPWRIEVVSQRSSRSAASPARATAGGPSGGLESSASSPTLGPSAPPASSTPQGSSFRQGRGSAAGTGALPTVARAFPANGASAGTPGCFSCSSSRSQIVGTAACGATPCRSLSCEQPRRSAAGGAGSRAGRISPMVGATQGTGSLSLALSGTSPTHELSPTRLTLTEAGQLAPVGGREVARYSTPATALSSSPFATSPSPSPFSGAHAQGTLSGGGRAASLASSPGSARRAARNLNLDGPQSDRGSGGGGALAAGEMPAGGWAGFAEAVHPSLSGLGLGELGARRRRLHELEQSFEQHHLPSALGASADDSQALARASAAGASGVAQPQPHLPSGSVTARAPGLGAGQPAFDLGGLGFSLPSGLSGSHCAHSGSGAGICRLGVGGGGQPGLQLQGATGCGSRLGLGLGLRLDLARYTNPSAMDAGDLLLSSPGHAAASPPPLHGCTLAGSLSGAQAAAPYGAQPARGKGGGGGNGPSHSAQPGQGQGSVAPRHAGHRSQAAHVGSGPSAGALAAMQGGPVRMAACEAPPFGAGRPRGGERGGGGGAGSSGSSEGEGRSEREEREGAQDDDEDDEDDAALQSDGDSGFGARSQRSSDPPSASESEPAEVEDEADEEADEGGAGGHDDPSRSAAFDRGSPSRAQALAGAGRAAPARPAGGGAAAQQQEQQEQQQAQRQEERRRLAAKAGEQWARSSIVEDPMRGADAEMDWSVHSRHSVTGHALAVRSTSPGALSEDGLDSQMGDALAGEPDGWREQRRQDGAGEPRAAYAQQGDGRPPPSIPGSLSASATASLSSPTLRRTRSDLGSDRQLRRSRTLRASSSSGVDGESERPRACSVFSDSENWPADAAADDELDGERRAALLSADAHDSERAGKPHAHGRPHDRMGSRRGMAAASSEGSGVGGGGEAYRDDEDDERSMDAEAVLIGSRLPSPCLAAPDTASAPQVRSSKAARDRARGGAGATKPTQRDIFSPLVIPPSASLAMRNSSLQEQRPANATQVASLGKDAEDDDVVDLLYDPTLNCYYEPRTGKYYELHI